MKYNNTQQLSSVLLADEKSKVSVEFAYYVVEAEDFEN